MYEQKTHGHWSYSEFTFNCQYNCAVEMKRILEVSSRGLQNHNYGNKIKKEKYIVLKRE